MKRILYLLVLLQFCSCRQRTEVEQIDFSSKVWLKGDILKRGQMVDSLIKRKILIDKTKTEVVEILGKPTHSEQEIPFIYQVDFNKKVGPIGIGGRWLFEIRVDFDSTTNKVISVICID